MQPTHLCNWQRLEFEDGLLGFYKSCILFTLLLAVKGGMAFFLSKLNRNVEF